MTTLKKELRNCVIRNDKETLLTLSRKGLSIVGWLIHHCQNGVGFVVLPSLSQLKERCVTALLENDPILDELIQFTKIIELLNRPNETLYLYLTTKY